MPNLEPVLKFADVATVQPWSTTADFSRAALLDQCPSLATRPTFIPGGQGPGLRRGAVPPCGRAPVAGVGGHGVQVQYEDYSLLLVYAFS